MRKSKIFLVLPVLITFLLAKTEAASPLRDRQAAETALSDFLNLPQYLRDKNLISIGNRAYYIIGREDGQALVCPVDNPIFEKIVKYPVDEERVKAPSAGGKTPDPFERSMELGRALNNRNLSEAQFEYLSREYEKAQAEIRKRAEEARKREAQRIRDSRLESDIARQLEMSDRIALDERRANLAIQKELSERSDLYKLEVGPLGDVIVEAIQVLEQARLMSLGRSIKFNILYTDLFSILDFTVKELDADVLSYGFPRNGRLVRVMSFDNLKSFDNQIPWEQIPMVDLDFNLGKKSDIEMGKMVDISYVYNILEKIREKKEIEAHEAKLVSALMKNFTSTSDRRRFFVLIYGYQARQNLLQSVREATLEFSQRLNIDMLRLFLVSFLPYGIPEDKKLNVAQFYEKIMSANKNTLNKILESVLGRRLDSWTLSRPDTLDKIVSNLINRIVFLSLVQDLGSSKVLGELNPPRRGNAAEEEVTEYVERLNYVLELEYLTYLESLSNSDLRDPNGKIRVQDTSDKIKRISENYFLQRKDGPIRYYYPNAEALLKVGIKLPEFFSEVIIAYKKAIEGDYRQHNLHDAVFMVKNRDRMFKTSSGSGLRCVQVL